MKLRLSSLVLGLISVCGAALAGSRDAAWQSVHEAVAQGLPQTAIQRLEPLAAAALADGAHAEAIKALAMKIAFEANIEGNKPEEKIVRLQAEIARVPAAMHPVMEAILAHWYWQFYQQNRWRFMQRTATAEPAGDDIQTWDLARMLSEIDRHFQAALADPAALQAIPIREYDALLERGTVPDAYRPTLFDFLAHEALEFYQAGEQARLAPEEESEIAATGPIFGEAAEFLRWEPEALQPDSPQQRAIALHQALLAFHRNDVDRSAFHDADLARLTYGLNVSFGEEKESRYRSALERFIDATADHEISGRALALLAEQWLAADEPLRAHELAERGARRFRGSAGNALCRNLLARIEAPSASVRTEFVWNAPWPTLDITYRNVTKLHFRAVPVDFADYIGRVQWQFPYPHDTEIERDYLDRPATTWTTELPATRDFKERTEHVAPPVELKPGFYLLFASHDPWFGERDNQVSRMAVWVSDLALILRTEHDQARGGGLVLRAGSGEPVPSATVRFWQRDRNGRFHPAQSTRTDENGEFRFPSGNEAFIALAEHGGHAVSSQNESYFHGQRHREREQTRTVFFTDRALYRPGQSIHYKGVSIRFDQADATYAAVAKRRFTVLFKDPNGEEIARATHTSNDYGSFSGVFTAPRDRLMGRMAITLEDQSSATSVTVEEYKRPKFQVELQPPAEAAKLDAPVTVTGKATAYTGAAIGQASVRWRVERAVQLPPWCWWWQPVPNKAIAHGTAVTEPDGSFEVQFTAVPDRSVPAKNEPVFVYTVYADVTDSTGETRSDERRLRAGYTALQATLTADDWQTQEHPVTFTLATRSLDQDPQPATGTLSVHALKQPSSVARASLQPDWRGRWWRDSTPPVDPTNPDSWELAERVHETAFTTDESGTTQLTVRLEPGFYRALLETRDRFGKPVTARHTVHVLAPQAPQLTARVPNVFAAPTWSVEPGETFTALWGTGYDTGRAFVELECNGKTLRRYWTPADRTQALVEQRVTEELRGGFTLRITYVRENRAYVNERVVNVPWTDREFTVEWERFRSKLRPGEKETWTAVVRGPNATHAAAEMVAALYDASLDQFLPHDWPEAFDVFRTEYARSHVTFQNTLGDFRQVLGRWEWRPTPVRWSYRSFPDAIVGGMRGYGFARAKGIMARPAASAMRVDEEEIQLSPFMVEAESAGYMAANTLAGTALQQDRVDAAVGHVNQLTTSPKPDLSQITARRNLNETAFFFPHLTTDDDGNVRMTFTMPEALTEWKFLGFAHDAQLRSGYLSDTVVTAKELMVEPNPPRFVREGDTIEFTVKVSNQADAPQAGTVRLTFADAGTQQSVDAQLANRETEQSFTLPAKQSRSFSWRISVPDGLGFLSYKAVAASTGFSDGEEGHLPVLSRRTLVTESLPLPIRGPATKQFEFTKLLQAGGSDTLRHQSLTVQMTSQPAWYAVMALPYLMEFPYECSEQVFNRLYANALARHIANSDPKIRRVFELWKNTDALVSPLEQNEELKSVMLEETPWVRQARSETESRQHLGLLFDANRLDEEAARTLRKLADQQLDDDLWPWFPGGRSSEYISLYIMTGFGRLRHLGVELDPASAVKSLGALDAWMTERHRRIRRDGDEQDYVPSPLDALYLYGRSFFRRDQPVADAHQEAVDFYLRQARTHWLRVDSRQSQAHLALALHRFGDEATPAAILRSIKERSVRSEELGMFWRELEFSWWWYRAPIETQALMIEAFAEITNDAAAVEECKVWLLKQKQTQAWRTTKATADAVYGLLLRGQNLLASDALVEVALGGTAITPTKVEAGTGFYQERFAAGEITPAMGEITVRKVDEGVSWGGVHWQYLEDIAKITPHEGTPLRLKKTLFVKQTTERGPVLQPVTGPLAVGDELVVRIELRTDRDMEFVHLKDQRGSGTEPVNVLSRYKYQDGLAYYESTRDTASHFFIDYLPKGTYVFEYSTRVQLRGRYQSGLAEIQCMYAPEFNSHSESIELVVQ